MDPPECSGHSHDHDHGGDDLGLSLRPQIDFPRVFCLNEEVANSGQLVLKQHEDRLAEDPTLRSPDDDAELLLHIPFTESVTIQSISVRGTNRQDTSAPRTLKIFCDRDDLDFETARELPPQAKLELLPPHHFVEGSIDYPLRPAGRFQNLSSVTLFFEDNYSEEQESCTEISYVGLKGKGTKMKRVAVEAVYETQAMPEDHEVHSGGIGAKEGFGS